jgi:hypothetical protein
MCNICNNLPLNFQALTSLVANLRGHIGNVPTLISNAIQADNFRFSSGSEWDDPSLARSVRSHIFANPNPDEGLLLFVLACWLDMQVRYTIVWNTYLGQTRTWLQNNAWMNPSTNVPRGKFRHTYPHLVKAVSTLSSNRYNRSFSAWFVTTVLNIVQQHGPVSGNLYRFVAKVCDDLYLAADKTFLYHVGSGNIPTNYNGAHYKRLWMFIMFLRRDDSVIRCLVERAVQGHPQGNQAVGYWYDPKYFDPKEIELPVDVRVRRNWNNLGFSHLNARFPQEVAMQARTLASQHGISPSTFDALLFF